MKKEFKITKPFFSGSGDGNLQLVIPKKFEREMELTEDTRFFTYMDKDKLIFRKLKLEEVM